MPAVMAMADSALTRARVEPTERSMPPVVMTRVIAVATIRVGALWRTMLSRLLCDRNPSATTANTAQTTAKNTAMLTTPALSTTNQDRRGGAGRLRAVAGDGAVTAGAPRGGRRPTGR